MSSSPSIVAANDRAAERTARRLPAAVRAIVIARLAPEARASHADLIRDLSPYLSQKLAAGAIRDMLSEIVAELVDAGLAVEDRGRITLLDRGNAEARKLLAPAPLPKDWIGVRDCRLVPLALGITGQPAAKLKAIGTPDGLRAAILQTTHSLPQAPRATAATLRSELAIVALGRAFGPSVRAQIRARDGFPAKTARVLAGQLSRRPRDLGTDAKLIAALAAEAVGAFQTDADAVKTAVLRRWTSASIDAVEPQFVPPVVARDASEPHRPAAANRPGLDGFVAAVQEAARHKADGWSGNRKAAIARVYDAVTLGNPAWGLTEPEFKAMLVEAHRLGRVVLATADLKTKDNLPELQRSAISFKNAVLHFVRVDE